MAALLTIEILRSEAVTFAKAESKFPEPSLYGVTDGKAVGTHLEHKFQAYLQAKYQYAKGSSAKGIDFPELDVDIKVTSVRQPQSSCPFKSARQKIYGLGYSLLVFVYDKQDDSQTQTGRLDLQHTIFVEKERTADYQITVALRQMVENGANRDDILACFEERLLPVDSSEAEALAEEVLRIPPQTGYLTISNALQWSASIRQSHRAGWKGGRGFEAGMNSRAKIEFGDFQTPQTLARQICTMIGQRGIIPDVVIEPTCGLGSFLVAAAESFPHAQLSGWDINGGYVEKTRATLNRIGIGGRATVAIQDFFKHDWEAQIARFQGNLLILGNLPWVTNAAVSGLNGANLPEKRNFQRLRGIEARTGKSNFDISEWMLIQLIKSLRGTSATVAMLCKTAIARKLLRFAWQNDGRIATASLHRIDAKRHFAASVDACLLLVQTGSAGPAEAPVFEDLHALSPSRILGMAGEDLVSDLRVYQKLKHLEGLCPYQWRSGVKHDCSSVMELWRDEGNMLSNKLGEHVELEQDFLFPLLKCSDLANGRTEPRRFVLITQTRVGEDTFEISRKAPCTWKYLNSHRGLFEARKSSIYTNRLPFALFGIGDYSFAPWKVAISGLHKIPRFVTIGPFQDKPVFFDDTCHFLPFQDPQEARVVTDILNSEPCLGFISSLLFEDSKRPITVELLQRLNLHAIAESAELADRWASVRNQRSFYSNGRVRLQAEFLLERASRDRK